MGAAPFRLHHVPFSSARPEPIKQTPAFAHDKSFCFLAGSVPDENLRQTRLRQKVKMKKGISIATWCARVCTLSRHCLHT
ncbi:MAG: hypothetical protein KGL59_11170, partial [Acidobacteriota bacterium]|nr:hypothetical protein [Acidobacteriota bacterium]